MGTCRRGRRGGAALALLMTGLFDLGCDDTVTVIAADAGGDAGPDSPMLEGSDPEGRDGGTPTAAELTIAPPNIPWLEDGEPPIAPPVLTPCPAGWSEVADDGFTYCEPWTPGAAEDCGPGQAHLPGQSACAPLGDACPAAGDFASGLPGGTAIVYVRAGAAGGGDGSLGAPFATLAQVPFATLASGTVVALSAGSYEGPVEIPAGVTVWGACAAETQIGAAAPGAEPVVRALGADVVLRDLRVGPAPREGVAVEAAGATLRLDAVEIRETECVALRATGDVSVDADGLAVRDVSPCLDEGRTVQMTDGASATLRRALLARIWGVEVHDGTGTTELVLEDSMLWDMVLPDGVGTLPPGMDPNPNAICHLLGDGTDASASIQGTAVVVESIAGVAACAAGSAASLAIDRALLRGGTRGALRALDGAALDVRRAAVLDFASGISATNVGPDANAAPLRVEDTVFIENVGGNAVSGYGRVRSEVRRVVGIRNDLGLFPAEVYFLGGQHTLEDVRLGKTLTSDEIILTPFGAPVTRGGGLAALGIGVLGPSYAEVTLEARRMRIEQVRAAAISVGGSAGGRAEISFEDLVIANAMEPTAPRFGGLVVVGLGLTTVRRVHIDAAVRNGIAMTEGASLDLEDGVIESTQATEIGTGGRGLWLDDGQARLERVRFSDHREVTIGTWNESVLALEDTTIEGTQARACTDDAVACVPGGHGLGIYDGSAAHVERFVIRDSSLCGAQLAGSASLDFHAGEVAGALVGVCLQVDPYDVERLSDRVRYFDNATNLQATRLPVPDPSAEE